MTALSESKVIAPTRWDQWEKRYERSSRKREKHARIATAVIFVAIIANLLFQVFGRGV